MLWGNDPGLCTDNRMIDLAADKRKILVTHKQRGIVPVAEETAIGKCRELTAFIGNEVVFAITEKVAIIENHAETVP